MHTDLHLTTNTQAWLLVLLAQERGVSSPALEGSRSTAVAGRHRIGRQGGGALVSGAHVGGALVGGRAGWALQWTEGLL
jgi:hypothetical protein